MIQIVTTLDEMKKLEPAWDSLGKLFPSPMLQFSWFYNCAKFLYPESQLRIFLLYSDSNLIAIAPLVRVKYKFSFWLEILGTSKIYEPSGLLYKDNASLTKLIKTILHYGFPINFQRIPICSPEPDISSTTRRPLRLCIMRKSASSYHLNAEKDWDKFLLKSGKKWAADFRNKANRAKRQGDIRIEFIRPDADTLSHHLQEAMTIELHSWKGEQNSALLNNKKLRAFFESYFCHCAKNNKLLFAFYRLNNQAIAMHIAELHSDKLWSYKIGYDSSFSRISPGMQLILAVLKDAFSYERAYEFLGSSESWQKAWPVIEHEYCSIILYPLSFRGIIGFLDTMTEVLRNKLSHTLYSLINKKP